MLATICSRLAVRPFTGAGISGAVQLSRAKLCPTQTGSGRLSTTSPDLQMAAKDLPGGGGEDSFATGCGAALATSKTPGAASAARSPAPIAILFNIKPPYCVVTGPPALITLPLTTFCLISELNGTMPL